MATIIRPGDTPQDITPKNGRFFTLIELQGFVGGYIEAVSVPPDGVRLMILNEDGKRLDLPVNEAATMIMHARPWLHPDDFIVGVALIVTREEMGEDDDATAAELLGRDDG